MSLKVNQFHRDNGSLEKISRREQRMNSKATAVLLSGLLFACAQAQPPEAAAPSAPSPPAASAPAPAPAQPSAAEPAPTDHIVNIQRASCQDLLRLSPEDRAAATMF